jgi:predicted permease
VQIIDTLAPIIIVIAIGAILRASGFITAELTRGLNKLVFWVGMPALLFVKIATVAFEPGPPVRIAAATMGVMVLVALVVDLAQRLLRTPGPIRGAVSQASFRSNCVYIGLVVLLFALEGQPGVAAIERSATLALGAIIPFLSIASVLVLIQHDGGGSRGQALRATLRSVGTNPFVIACLAALPFSLWAVPLPDFLTRSCQALGRMALPVALLGIGASLRWEPVRRHLGRSVLVALLKLAVMPALGLAAVLAFGIPDDEAFVILVFLACPTAVTAYVMAEQMDADAELSAAAIVLTTVLAVIPLSLLLAIYAPGG